MNLLQLRTSARAQVDDSVAPYLCSDELFTEFANEAQEEACRRARLLVDSSTPEVCNIDVDVGDEFAELDARIIAVRKVRVVGQPDFLVKTRRADLDHLGTTWLDEEGEVCAWVPDMETGKIRLYRKPTEAIQLAMTVVRLPLDEMAADDDAPEIKLQMHRQLVHWMRYRFYSLPDAEANDPKKATDALLAFEQQFGPASTAADELWSEQQYGFDEYDGSR